MIESPSGRSLEKTQRWNLMGTEACGGGKVFWWMPLMVSEYFGIYSAKIRVGGLPRGPQAPRDSPNPNSSSINTQIFPVHHRAQKNPFPPPQASVLVRSHLGAFSGTPPEGDSITEGLYTNLAALPMMCD